MDFTFSTASLVNIIFITIGIGIVGLCMLQILASLHIRKAVRVYFIIFFSTILLYITAHLAREIMNGLPGQGVRVGLYIVTFVEMLFAGAMSELLCLLILTVAKQGKSINGTALGLHILLLIHIVLLIVSWPLSLIYYFDADNLYVRGPAYMVSNIFPLLTLIFDAYLLIRYRKNIARSVLIAFWIYIIAPVIAIAIQSFTNGVQLIIFATIICSFIMYSVVIYRQTSVYEKQKMDSSRIEAELTMASSIQSDMLPTIYPAFPERSEFDIYAGMNPAKEVGGDFYNFFLVDNDHLCMMIADVSGKGVPAALFMMASMIIFANNAMVGKSPAQILTDSNKMICASNREGMFVTVWIGILDIKTGKMIASNAGHEFPVVCGPDGKFEYIKDKHGLVIGGFDTATYEDYTIDLKPGSKLYVYTDGVTEATRGDDELYGFDRLKEALNKNSSLSPKEMCDQISVDINNFVAGAEQFDDITMLALEYKGK